MDRRSFLRGILAAAVAPAFVKTAGLLMPVKPLVEIVPAFTDMEGLTDLTAVVRRAFVPRLIQQIYRETPLMSAFLLEKPADGGRLVMPVLIA